MAALALGGGAVSAIGTLAGGSAAATTGSMQQQAQQFAATQDTMNAAADVAAGGRAGVNLNQKANLLRSTAVANAGAGGVESTTGSALTNQAQIVARGKYSAAMDLANGQNAAAGDLNKAAAARFTGLMDEQGGQIAQTGSEFAAAGTLMGAGGSAYKNFNGGGGGGAINGGINVPGFDPIGFG
jgi:hypothetical protein